jgi:hypothetical protein
MGRFFSPAVLFAFLLCAVAAQGQPPPPVPPCPVPPAPPPPCIPVAPPPIPVVAPPCVYPAPIAPPPCGPEALFAIEAMLGQELGVRGQLSLYRDRHESIVVEGFYGELYHNLGSSEALGTGARWLFRNSWPGCLDSVQFGPGVDVFFQLNHNDLILLTPSFDVAWLHKVAPGVEFELGLEAGLGIGVSGRTKDGHDAAGDVTTLISVYTGLRF